MVQVLPVSKWMSLSKIINCAVVMKVKISY